MRILKIIFFILPMLILTFTFFLFWAVGPAVAPKNFPSEGVVEIPLKETPHASLSNNDLTVVTYNIGYASGAKNNQGSILEKAELERNLQSIVEALSPFNPDIVLLQEVDLKAKRSFNMDQMEVLARGLSLPFAAYAITWNHRYVAWPYWPPAKHFGSILSGQVILSRYPIKKQETLHFEKPQENPFWYNWFYINRLVQKAEVDWHGKTVTVYNAHLEAFSSETRGQQIEKLSQWIQENETNTRSSIVGGDFNAVWDGEGEDPQQDKTDKLNILQFLKTTQLKLAGADEKQLSFPSWAPQKGIDFIFYDKNFRLMKTGVLAPLKASDHLPIWGRFSLIP